MKTTTTLLSLLLAAGSTALAQESSSTQVHQVRRFVIGSGGSGTSGTGGASDTATGAEAADPAENPNVSRSNGGFVVGGGSGTGGPVPPGGYSVPTVRVDQIVDPVDWSFIDGSQGIESAIRAHFQSGPVTYLGVTTSPPAGEVAAQLAIPFGTGLVVNVIGDGSPAEKAGIQQHDVLTKLDDQILIDPGQLAVLVVNHKEGDTVKLTLIRKGQSQEVPVVLGKRDASANPGSAHSLPGNIDLLLDGKLQQPLRTYTRRLQLNLDGKDAAGGTSSGDYIPADVLEGIKKSMQEAKGAARQAVDAAGKVTDEAIEDSDEAAKSVRDELKDVRRMLEDLSKKIDEQQK
jgi:hypothetical protein